MAFSENYLQTHMAGYGYTLAETPIVEQAWLFLAKAGDQIVERLVMIERGGRELALRPEFTASAAYQYLQQSEKVVRWQFSGPVFEDATGSTIGVRQRYNMGAELIGLQGATADAEIMQMAALGLDALGLSDWQMVIGHVGLMRAMLDSYALDERSLRFLLNHRGALHVHGTAHILERLDHYLNGSAAQSTFNSPETIELLSRDDIRDHFTRTLLSSVNPQAALGGRTREEIARRLLQKQQQAANREQILAACQFLEDWGKIHAPVSQAFEVMNFHTRDNTLASGLIEEWHKTVNILLDAGLRPDQIIIQPDLARTWDYYTGAVFELRLANRSGNSHDYSLAAGGGRYDELIQLIGGKSPVPAVGFAYYVDAIRQVLKENQPL